LKDATNRVDDASGGFLLVDVTHCTSMKGALGIKRFRIHRPYEHAGRRSAPSNATDQIETVTAAERDIDHGNIRLARVDLRKRFRDARRLAADLHIGVACDADAQSLANDGVVVHNEDSRDALTGYRYALPHRLGPLRRYTQRESRRRSPVRFATGPRSSPRDTA